MLNNREWSVVFQHLEAPLFLLTTRGEVLAISDGLYTHLGFTTEELNTRGFGVMLLKQNTWREQDSQRRPQYVLDTTLAGKTNLMPVRISIEPVRLNSKVVFLGHIVALENPKLTLTKGELLDLLLNPLAVARAYCEMAMDCQGQKRNLLLSKATRALDEVSVLLKERLR